jgi:hypothetical protein
MTVPLVMFTSRNEPTVVLCGAADATCDTAVQFGYRLRRETIQGQRLTIGVFEPNQEDQASVRGPSTATLSFWREASFTTTLPNYLVR